VLRLLSTSHLDAALVQLIGNLVYYLTLAVAVIAVLGVVGIETASLITVLGASSLAVGLALQGSLSNFASGVMLHLFHPYRVGDYIQTGEFSGTVAELGVFSTRLDTLDNVRVVLPNTYVAERPLENWSANEARRLDLEIEIAIDADLPAARAAIDAELRREARVLDQPPPAVGVADFGDTSARLVVRPWCRPADYWALRFELPERVKAAVERAGFSLPCPQREIRWTGEGPDRKG
jgi:small conductance mechanosensitive channel